jgi:hypothetical protein
VTWTARWFGLRVIQPEFAEAVERLGVSNDMGLILAVAAWLAEPLPASAYDISHVRDPRIGPSRGDPVGSWHCAPTVGWSAAGGCYLSAEVKPW